MRWLVVVVLCLLGAGWAQADVPTKLHYQGYLTDSSGNVFHCDLESCEEPVSLTFRLYEQLAGGDALWVEAHENVVVSHGVFNLIIGLVVPLEDEMLANARWLGVEANQQGEMFPRQQLVSTPFAFRAAVADHADTAADATHLGGVVAENFVQASQAEEFLTAADLLETLQSLGFEPEVGWGDILDIPADVADGDDDILSTLLCAAGEMAKWDGLGWSCADDIDTQLDEAEVDAFVENNGFALQTALDAGLAAEAEARGNAVDGVQANLTALDGSLDPIAKDGLPADLADGDDDALSILACAEGEVARWDGSQWLCAPRSVLETSTVTTRPDCTAENIGYMYYDVDTDNMHVCDGTSYRRIRTCVEGCPDPASVACDETVANDCGDDCGSLGSGVNLNQCNASLVSCEQAVLDSCGNDCGTVGTALDLANCTEAAEITCGQPTRDACGNDCGETGSLCDTGSCTGGICLVSGSCKEILDAGGSVGDGLYTIDPDGDFGDPPFEVYCDMTAEGGGWTRIDIDYLRLHANLTITTAPGIDDAHGFVQGNTIYYGYPQTDDREVWNDFDLEIDYTDIRGTVIFYPSGGHVDSWSTSGANPDNNNYGIQSDTDYDELEVTGPGGNKSWHRWGKPGQVFHAYDQLGWVDSWEDTKTLTFGTMATVSGSVIRFSTFSESGDSPRERWAFAPTVYIR